MIETLENRQMLSVAPALPAAGGFGSKVAGIFVDRDHAGPTVQAAKVKYPPLTNLTAGTWSGAGEFKVKKVGFSKRFKLKIEVTFSNLTATTVDVNMKITGDLNETINTTGKGKLVTTGKKTGTFSYTFPDQNEIKDLKLTSGLIKQISSKSDQLTGKMSGKLDLGIVKYSKAFNVKLKRAHIPSTPVV
ncbi:MAG TPA: hypothetical protein VK324_01545 [Tepidisphaeraceae bacterium]|nr:hypothetical protein [Tepidisphaeraceae bacterium]